MVGGFVTLVIVILNAMISNIIKVESPLILIWIVVELITVQVYTASYIVELSIMKHPPFMD
jgi:hypothetical protein